VPAVMCGDEASAMTLPWCLQWEWNIRVASASIVISPIWLL
jgi:hypothetical protein